MSLDALAPDQRAVVQLVLQQDRSYDDLAALLGITPDAVRERAHRGLERLAPAEGVEAADRGEIADYLLGQQSEAAEELTWELLERSEPARAWALALSDDLAGVARSPLPEVPAGDEPEPTAAEPEPEPEPARAASLSRARPRPRREPAPVPDFGFDEPDEDADRGGSGRGTARTSRLGGALLLAGLAIGLAALIIVLVSKDDSDEPSSASASGTSSATATATATGTASYAPIGYLNLRSTDGGGSKGRFIVYASQDRKIAFNVLATKVPQTPEGTAYGVWLTGGGANHFLGYAPAVGKDGRLRVSGPRQSDQAAFATWFTKAKRIVVSSETKEGGTAPGPVVLDGTVKQLKAAPTATATATP